MFFNRKRPEYAVDAVASLRIEIVQHQHVHEDVVNKKVRNIDPGGDSCEPEEDNESNEIRRIESAQTSFPKCAKLNLMVLTSSARFRPLEVNTKTRDDEKEEDSDITKRGEKLDHSHRIAKEIVWDRAACLVDRMIKNDAQCGNAAQGVNT